MALQLPELPFAHDALAPVMSAESFEYHHGKHHNTYVVNGNKLLDGSGMEDKSVEDIVRATANDSSKAGIFNNVAQHWNHSFFWNSLKPGGGKIPGALEAKIREDFGSVDEFKDAFVKNAAAQFGSGWAWLVMTPQGKLELRKTPNAETPLTEEGVTPLITCDVWEHAYYIDYRNARPKFVEAFLDDMANWEFAAENMEKAA